MQITAIRRVQIDATTRGVDEATAKLNKLAGAQDNLAVVSDRSTRAQLSMDRVLERMQRQYDQAYRAQQALAKVERDLGAARAQGLGASIVSCADLISVSPANAENPYTTKNAARTADRRRILVSFRRVQRADLPGRGPTHRVRIITYAWACRRVSARTNIRRRISRRLHPLPAI